jgi:pimeloyl-ACP methyl ester carboxylesterase
MAPSYGNPPLGPRGARNVGHGEHLVRHHHQPLIDDLRAIGQPVRIAVGDRDEVVTLAECAEACAALPRGALEVFPSTRHPFERVGVPRLAWSLREFLGVL